MKERPCERCHNIMAVDESGYAMCDQCFYAIKLETDGTIRTMNFEEFSHYLDMHPEFEKLMHKAIRPEDIAPIAAAILLAAALSMERDARKSLNKSAVPELKNLITHHN